MQNIRLNLFKLIKTIAIDQFGLIRLMVNAIDSIFVKENNIQNVTTGTDQRSAHTIPIK